MTGYLGAVISISGSLIVNSRTASNAEKNPDFHP